MEGGQGRCREREREIHVRSCTVCTLREIVEYGIGEDIHKCSPDVFGADHTLLLILEFLVCGREETERLPDLVFFFGGDVVLLGQLGLPALLLFRGSRRGATTAPFRGLNRGQQLVSLLVETGLRATYHLAA